MTDGEWVIAAATLMGPVFAVQAQKFVERAQERRKTKQRVFQQLMATRQTRLSIDHVQALNMIDLAFDSSRKNGFRWRSRKEKWVVEAWREYNDHLSHGNSASPDWFPRGDELLMTLLAAMADEAGFHFDKVLLKRGAYSPIAHGELEKQQQTIRQLLIQVLSGNNVLKTAVLNQPTAPEFGEMGPRRIYPLNGLWSVEFISSIANRGFGLAVFHGGKILGGDAEYTYQGDFWIVDDLIAGNINVVRYSGSGNSVFGALDKFNLNVSGKPAEQSFSLHGFVVDNPDNTIEIKLTRRP